MKNFKLKIDTEHQELVVKSIRELAESYLTYSINNTGWKQIKLSNAQLKVLGAIENNQFNVIKKCRQVGFSTIMYSIISSRLVSNDPWDIVMVVPNSSMIPYITCEILQHTNELCHKLDLNIKPIIDTVKCLTFNNDNRFQIVSSESVKKEVIIGDNRLINHTRWVIFDEFAYCENKFDLFNWATNKGQSTDQITIASTQNIADSFFRALYIACRKKENWNSINLKPEGSQFLLDKFQNISKSLPPSILAIEFGDSFIVPDFDSINIEKFIKEINSFLPDDNEFTIRDFMDLISSRIITEKIDN